MVNAGTVIQEHVQIKNVLQTNTCVGIFQLADLSNDISRVVRSPIMQAGWKVKEQVVTGATTNLSACYVIRCNVVTVV